MSEQLGGVCMKLTEEELLSMPRDFVYNAVKTPDGTVLHSKHRHDYIEYKDANGELYVLDGGNDYRRCSINKEPFVDISVRMCHDIEDIREHFVWGTYGKGGDQPLTNVLLKDMSNAHIQAIAEDGYPTSPLMKLELKFREINDIFIED